MIIALNYSDLFRWILFSFILWPSFPFPVFSDLCTMGVSKGQENCSVVVQCKQVQFKFKVSKIELIKTRQAGLNSG